MLMATSRFMSLGLLLGCLGWQFATAQQAGTLKPEVHPDLWMQVDCEAGSCKREKGSVVLDANWRWIQRQGQNCYTGAEWDSTVCSDGEACAQTCSVEGADYEGTYGITSNSDSDGVNLRFVTKHAYGANYGSRMYIMDSDDSYKLFKLKNREFTFDVDVSNLPCGLNGALYFVEMDRHGDLDGSGNTAGAKYGTGYCDAQCPHDLKFIKGSANTLNWNSTSVPPVGHFGSCCAELDIWEANSMASAYTPHPCSQPGSNKCEGTACGDNVKGERYMGICDKDGCDFNAYRMGDKSFYGNGADFQVDASKPMTVVTQFLTHNGTDAGELSEIRRFYVQSGKVIPNSLAVILGPSGGNSITDEFCSKQKSKFGDMDDFAAKGALSNMGAAMDRGMVLVLSLWDDTDVSMLWLDSTYPTDESPATPGVLRGPCPGGEQSKSAYLRAKSPDAHVAFSKIKFGTINSTFSIVGGRRMTSTYV